MSETQEYELSKHTRNKFKEWLSKASYPDILEEYNRVKNLIMILSSPNRRAEKPQKKIERLPILRWKNSLLTQRLLKITGQKEHTRTKRYYSL